jgi:FkbM family methyltransferase
MGRRDLGGIGTGGSSLTVSEAVALHIPGMQAELQLYVHGPEDKHVSRKIREQGLWEPFETSLIVSRLKAGDVFVDVGANIGYFTIIAASLVGEQGQVYAFEPDPENYRLLQENCAHNFSQSNVHAVCGGLSSRDCAGQLFLSEDNLGDHQIYAGTGEREQLDITLYHGADYLRRQFDHANFETLNLVKVDTQGSEFDVMLGLMPLLREMAVPPTILIELTPFSLRQAGSSGRELIELLAGLQQDFWIVDHIEHELVLSDAEALAQWCDNVDGVDGDEGFMNILIESEDRRACNNET